MTVSMKCPEAGTIYGYLIPFAARILKFKKFSELEAHFSVWREK